MEKSLLAWQKQIKGELKEDNAGLYFEKNKPIEKNNKTAESIINSIPKSERCLFEFVQSTQEANFPAIFTNNFTEIDLKVFLMQWKMKNGFMLP